MRMRLNDSFVADIAMTCEIDGDKKEIPVEYLTKPIDSIEDYHSFVRKLKNAVHLLNNGYDCDPFKAQHKEGIFRKDFCLTVKTREDFCSEDVDCIEAENVSVSEKAEGSEKTEDVSLFHETGVN